MNQRNALMKSLALSLLVNSKITTTAAKAKSLRPFVEKLVTNGKKGGLAAQRLLASRVGKEASSILLKTISPKYKDRKGGFTRIIKLPARKSDGSPMAVIEFV